MSPAHLAIAAAAAAVLLAAVPAAAGPGSEARPAQLPPPFGAPPPFGSRMPACSPQYQRLLGLQVEAMRRLQQLARGEGNRLCAALEGADALGIDKLIDPKALDRLLSPQQREVLGALGIDLAKVDVARLMRLLGIDPAHIDLRKLTHQCRLSQGEVDRFAAGEIGRIERELLRCDDRV